MSNNGTRNGSASGGGGGTTVSRESISPDRVWYTIRAYLDTICESYRATERVEGLDRAPTLRAFADVVDGSIATIVHTAELSRAEAADLAPGSARATILVSFADALDGSIAVLAQAASRARAEANALDQGRYAQVPDDESTTEIRRKAAREDSSPGRKRS